MGLIARSSKYIRSIRILNEASPIFVHLLMVTGVAIYTILGALIMQKLETRSPLENSSKITRRALLDNITKESENKITPVKMPRNHNKNRIRHNGNFVTRNRKCLEKVFRQFMRLGCTKHMLQKYAHRAIDDCYHIVLETNLINDEIVFRQSSKGFELVRSVGEYVEPWSFADAVLFCFTIITTIGYGNVAPKSFEGRLFCIFYGLIGVPFALLAIADLGKFLSEIIDGWERTHRRFYKELRKRWKYYKKSGRLLIKLPSDIKSFDTSYSEAGRLIKQMSSLNEQEKKVNENKLMLNENLPNNPHNHTILNIEEISNIDYRSEKIEDLNENNDEQNEEKKSTSDDEDDITSNQTTSLLIMFLLYIVTGSFMLSSYEPDMTFFKAFYFNFVSLTSIGLGDVIPQSETYLVFTLLYIAIGLALTTIAIEIAADTLKKLHYFGRQIENVGNVVIWFGGKKLTMKSLVKNLGDQLNLPTTTIKLLDLDVFIDNAIKVEEGELKTLRPPPIEPSDLDLEIVDFADDEQEEWLYERTPSPEPDPPTPHTARYCTPSPHTARRLTPEPQIARIPTPKPETARAVTPELGTARNLTPTTSPVTARSPSPEALSARLPTPIPSTARGPSPVGDVEEWKLRGSYSEEAYRRYLEYQKQWKRFRQTSHGDTTVIAAAMATATVTSQSPTFSSQSKKSRQLSEKEIKSALKAEKKAAKKPKKK